MKKYLNYAFSYAILALVGGVFYREFTKWNGFTGVTVLGKIHTHLIMLGMFVYLIVALFANHFTLESEKTFRIFHKVYNIGLPLMVIMMVVRGITQVLGTSLSKGTSAMISGIAGIGHILVATGIVCLLLALKKLAKN